LLSTKPVDKFVDSLPAMAVSSYFYWDGLRLAKNWSVFILSIYFKELDKDLNPVLIWLLIMVQ
jgi:hypothetical protein